MNQIYDLPERLLTLKLCFPLILRSHFKQYLDECLIGFKYSLIKQFETITSKTYELERVNQFTYHAALHSDNYYLNRYDDILPYDQTRVILKDVNDHNLVTFDQLSMNSTGYINANFIRTIEPPTSSNDTMLRANNQCEFIATQGPLKKTIGDFWHMVYIYQCPIIIMLTGLKHNTQSICDLYWPEELNTTKQYEYSNIRISVTLVNVNQSDCFIQRNFKVSSSIKPNELHNVIQIHSTKWENFGVPTLENMHKLVQAYENIYQDCVGQSTIPIGPTVVHCSAGVGRTGTFISVLVVRRHLRSDCQWISLPNIVLMLRLWRCFMVELKEQYIFLHEYFSYILSQ
ncbi:unnamed protein product [Heterobilharzia americana]|nr:unnamed protein product [Heterobilharzia americana]CAH8599043.1 unnamed protein product [Heterobilharzia americana]